MGILRLFALAVCLFAFTATAGAQETDVWARHLRLLDEQLARVEANSSGTPRLYVLAAGLSSKQDVFRNEIGRAHV